ncbi:MAG TPA: DNA methyltransferase, partial [Gemmataceae bacterium]|nr:DNA methyltransferase [Gemmataceae bacterium]
MPPLVDDLRTRLEKAVTAARDQAEAGARAALQRLYVDTVDSKAIPAGFPQDNRALRVHLRAHARQLGDEVPEKGPQRIDRLVAECAYEFWHRMLFARFLIENHLLIHPEHRQPIPLADLEEFAHEAGVKDKWEYAASCAARMLPEIFRPEDPLLRVPFAPEHQLALEQTLDGLPAETFTADDSLGWVYQFWQAKRKDEVNASEVKIGGAELPAVTQLFTEPYMVQFLLHNTLGAWWYARQVSGGRKVPALPGCTFDYLRFREAGNPAAGTFPGWPQRAAELKVLDPCCGSGHFLVAAFELLARIRMHDEGLAPREACDAVLRDNLFGLELDARCTQIAAFNLALAAWKFPDAGGYRQLPQMHIACSGQALRGRVEEWERLAGTNRNLRIGMRWLYEAFRQAPDLGSLLDPADVQLPLGVTLAHLLPLLRQALQGEEALADAELAEQGVAAWGIAKAAETLAGKYHLVTTNVPYLAKGRQSDELRQFAADHYSEGRMDLATVFLQRCLRFLAPHGLLAAITPQTWLFLTRYRKLREKVVRRSTWLLLANLGAGAFASISGEVVNVSAVVLSSEPPAQHHRLYGVEVIDEPGVAGKKRALRTTPLLSVTQSLQLDNPDS